jgi:hypothetical protein
MYEVNWVMANHFVAMVFWYHEVLGITGGIA